MTRYHAFLRWVLGILVALEMFQFSDDIPAARQFNRGSGFADGLMDIVSRPIPVWVICLAGALAGFLFALKPGRIRSGVVALLALVYLSSIHGVLFGSPQRDKFFVGLVLLGWLGGLVYGRKEKGEIRESYAYVGGVALLGAAYVCSGLSKLVYGGIEWLTGVSVRTMVVAQTGLVETLPILGLIRDTIVGYWWVAALVAIATIAAELGGVFFVFSRRSRVVAAFTLICMHLVIYVFTGIGYVASVVLLLTFVLLSPIHVEEASADGAPPGHLAASWVGAGEWRGIVPLIVIAVIAIIRQGLIARGWEMASMGLLVVLLSVLLILGWAYLKSWLPQRNSQ
jgi:hypothetical protein